MNNGNGLNWSEAVWQEINEAVVKEMAKVRTAQKVFPAAIINGGSTEIPNDVIDFSNFSIQEGRTKPFVEIYREFPLTSTQVSNEATSKTCKTLARMAAKQIALAEDVILFQGKKAAAVLKANSIQVKRLESAGDGLLGEAKANIIDVDKPKAGKSGVIWGEEVFAKVAKGISELNGRAQAPKFALFLPTTVYADTFAPPGDQSLVTTAERIKPLVEGGFHGTGTLPENSSEKTGEGLLVALGGDPTSLYVGQEATTEFLTKDGSDYLFRVVERVQFVARDARALTVLNFK